MTTDELKALLDGATPGPWEAVLDVFWRVYVADGGDYAGQCVGDMNESAAMWRSPSDEQPDDFAEANARLIALAPQLAAALIKAEEALIDATAHLVGAESAYREFAKRHQDIRPKAATDPFFTTRVGDFRKAADRARAAYLEISALTGGNDD